jgi:hypothetical protein
MPYKYKEDEKNRSKKYYQNNKDKISKYNKKYQEENREKVLKQKQIYREANKKRIAEYRKEYNKNNKNKILKHKNQYAKNKRKTDLKYNLSNRISRSIRHTIKDNKNGKHWESLVGYTTNDLIKHLQKTIPKGYTWQDFMEGKLHIDHIIPISVFNFTKPEHIDFKRCWSLKNLRLLPAEENLKKNNKLYKPFQPALKIPYKLHEATV